MGLCSNPFTQGVNPGRVTPANYYVLHYMHVEIHFSASRHRISANDVNHAVAHALVIVDLDPGSDPPKVLCIGPDRAGNLLEVIWLELADERPLVIHAMALRRIFFDLLPKSEADQ